MNDLDHDVRQGIWMNVGDDGSVKLSAACLAAAGLEPGGRVMARVVDGVIELVSHMTLAVELQSMIDKGLDPSAMLNSLASVDGLIVERRREFLMEERDFPAQHDAAE